MFNAQSPPNVGHRSFEKLADLTWQSGQRAITVSTNELNLAAGLGPAGLGGAFHDITVHSAGILADVRSGRLKRDLSNLLSHDVEEIQSMPLYIADGRMNRFAITEDGAVSNQPGFPSNYNALQGWGINLEELSLFHNLYREIEWNGQEPHLDPKDTKEAMTQDKFNLYRQPVLEAVHCIFSLSAVPDGGTASDGTTPTYKMKLMLDGMIALSNPNDISMEWNGRRAPNSDRM